VRYLAHLLAQVCLDGPVYYRDEQHQSGTFCADTAAQPEYDQPLVFIDNPNGVHQEDDDNDNHKRNDTQKGG
jgi:hypothetical protein